MRLKTLEEFLCETIEDKKSYSKASKQNNLLNQSLPAKVYRYINVNPEVSLQTNVNKDPLFIFVSHGNATLYVEDSFVVLQEQQCIFVNANRKVFINSETVDQNQLTFISFDEKMVSMCVGNIVESKYVLPILRSKLIDYHCFLGDSESDRK